MNDGGSPNTRWGGEEDLLALLQSAGSDEPASPELGGIRSLMLAVLEEGIRSYSSRDVRTRNEARRWIHERRHRTIFSFETICETLDLEPSAVRKLLTESPPRGGYSLDKIRLRRQPGRHREIDGPENGTTDS